MPVVCDAQVSTSQTASTPRQGRASTVAACTKLLATLKIYVRSHVKSNLCVKFHVNAISTRPWNEQGRSLPSVSCDMPLATMKFDTVVKAITDTITITIGRGDTCHMQADLSRSSTAAAACSQACRAGSNRSQPSSPV